MTCNTTYRSVLRTLLIPLLLFALTGCHDEADHPGHHDRILDDAPQAAGGREDSSAHTDPRSHQQIIDSLLSLPVSRGQWYYRKTPYGALAMFGEPETEPRFTIRCNQEKGTISLEKAGNLPSERHLLMHLYTSGMEREFEIVSGSEELPILTATLPQTDEWLKQLAVAEGTIAITTDTGGLLVMPTDSLIAKVINECGSQSQAVP